MYQIRGSSPPGPGAAGHDTGCQSDSMLHELTDLSLAATDRKREGSAHFVHPCFGEPGKPPAESVLTDGYEIVEVDGTRLLHPVIGAENDL
jgi:hypothetical protein